MITYSFNNLFTQYKQYSIHSANDIYIYILSIIHNVHSALRVSGALSSSVAHLVVEFRLVITSKVRILHRVQPIDRIQNVRCRRRQTCRDAHSTTDVYRRLMARSSHQLLERRIRQSHKGAEMLHARRVWHPCAKYAANAVSNSGDAGAKTSCDHVMFQFCGRVRDGYTDK